MHKSLKVDQIMSCLHWQQKSLGHNTHTEPEYRWPPTAACIMYRPKLAQMNATKKKHLLDETVVLLATMEVVRR